MKNLNIFKFFSTIKLSKNIFLSIISGVLLSLSFYSDNFSLLSFISIVPIFYLILNNEIKTKYLFSFYFSFYLGLMTWLFKLYPMSFLGIKPFESIIFFIYQEKEIRYLKFNQRHQPQGSMPLS